MAATEFKILCFPIRFKTIFLIIFFFPKKFFTMRSNLQFLILYFGLII